MRSRTTSVPALLVMLIISLGIPTIVVLPRLSYPLEFADLLYALGRIVGLIAFFMFTFQYVWTAKIKIFERLRSFDGRVAVHRTLGFLGISLLAFHPIFILLSFGLMGIPLQLTFAMVLGFTAFVMLFFIGASTFLSRISGVRYRVWKRMHRFTFPILTIAFFHSIRLGSDMYGAVRVLWIALALGLAPHSHGCEAGNRLRSRKHGLTEIVDITDDTPDTTSIVVRKPKGSFLPGQFAFVGLQYEGKWTDWHPFSLTSVPDDEHLQFTIKSVGATTRLIRQMKPGTPIRVDPGYGAFSHHFTPDDRYVMIAGGVGIAPIHSMIKDLVAKDDQGKVTLIYCVHHEDGLLFRSSLESWFAERPGWNLHMVCSRQKDWPGPVGRLTPELLVELLENDLEGTFFMCGPQGLVGSINRFLRNSGMPVKRIRREEFVFLP